MNLLVIGATGGTGIEVVRQALADGHNVIAFVRDPARLALQHEALRVVRGDIFDSEALHGALANAHAVISTLGVRLGQAPGTTRSRGTAALVEAMGSVGVERLVAVSTVGTAASRSAQSIVSRWLLPILIGTERLSEADAQEAVVASSGLIWTIVRPPRLIDGAATGRFRAAVGQRTTMRSQIRRADLARFLLDEAVSNRFAGSAPTVVGA